MMKVDSQLLHFHKWASCTHTHTHISRIICYWSVVKGQWFSETGIISSGLAWSKGRLLPGLWL